MSRHERMGAFMVLALIAVVIAMTWTVKTCTPPPPKELQQELLEWEQETDSARRELAHRDSVQLAEKASKRSIRNRRSKDSDNSHHSKSRKDKHSKQKRNSPSQPSGLPPTIPNY